jgi:hypothetical protein
LEIFALMAPFRDPESKPDWAQLTRWGGNRVANLFEELRRRIGVVEGLIEDLHFAGPEEGWVPRYSVGGETIAIAHIRPASLAATLWLGSHRPEMRKNATLGRDGQGKSILCVDLNTRAAVAYFARILIRTCGWSARWSRKAGRQGADKGL